MSGKSKRAGSEIVAIHAQPRGSSSPGATRLGTITAWSEAEGLFVDYPGNTAGPRAALSTVPLTADELAEIVASSRRVLLAFDGDPSGQPIVVGVVQAVPAAVSSSAGRAAVVDGENVVLEGEEQVELRCGKASIVLTKAGKILIQGTYISSRSSGAHRIRGGSVEVN
jgi:hypothetical protein